MPPKQKFTREEITASALDIVRQEGISGLTARGLGEALGCSSRPIFTAFRNMEEVRQEVLLAARAVYNSYVEKGIAGKPAFKGVGMQYIYFAKEEPRLFELLFMSQSETEFVLDDILPAIDENSERILASVQEEYGFGQEVARKFYQCLWLLTHGIACLCATGTSNITENEASRILTEVATGLIIKNKSFKEGETQ